MGPAFGADYELIDDFPSPGETYFYLLQDISTHGESTMHGAGACTLEPGEKCEPIRVKIMNINNSLNK